MDKTGNSTYLNTAACGLLPEKFTIEANQLYKDFAQNASRRAEYMRDTELDFMRGNVASFMGCSKENLAFMPNFSWGINGVVQSLRGTEKVLLFENDYPSLLEPFRINAFDISWLKSVDGFSISLDEIKERILSEDIDIVAISHVQWLSGYKIDIKELSRFCKKHDVVCIVDATQSLGAVEISLENLEVDVFISSVYKWVNAGFGVGVMYIADEFLDKYTPAIGGFSSYSMKDDIWQYIPSIKSYEPGGINMYGITVLNAAIKDKQERGLASIEKHNTMLTKLLIDNIQETKATVVGELDVKNRASIVSVKEQDGLFARLQANDILVAERGGNIRISMHYYNTDADVLKLVDVLKSS